jgi:hypothetical protein
MKSKMLITWRQTRYNWVCNVFPLACGYDPCIGSNKALVVPNDADANNPIEPVITLASSDKISPNKFSVKITSNCLD